MFESVESKAILSWLFALVIMGLVLWYALGFSQKQVAGVTLKEALAKRTLGYIRLGVIAALAAATSYYFDASNALVTLFAALPKALLVPADFLYLHSHAFFYFALVGEILIWETYKPLAVDPKTKESTERHPVANLLFMFGFLAVLFFSPESLGFEPRKERHELEHLGAVSLGAVVWLANQIHDYHKTVLTKQTIQKPIQSLYALVITYVTISLIALEVLPSTTALILLAILASCQAVKIFWILRYIP